jgi:hypothetical protein
MDQDERKRIEQEIRTQVARRVAAKMGFYWHGIVFVMVNVGLIAINLTYSPETRWFQWPLCAWGAALILHWFAVFPRGVTQDMIEAEVQREMAKRGLT